MSKFVKTIFIVSFALLIVSTWTMQTSLTEKLCVTACVLFASGIILMFIERMDE